MVRSLADRTFQPRSVAKQRADGLAVQLDGLRTALPTAVASAEERVGSGIFDPGGKGVAMHVLANF